MGNIFCSFDTSDISDDVSNTITSNFKALIKERLKIKEFESCQYDFKKVTIVMEHLPYVSREYEALQIVNYMRRRQNKRYDNLTFTDKSCNPLIAIPGCPGIGKSTFLTHFPMSSAFKQYVLDISPEKTNVVVSVLSFNSSMDDFLDVFGLRIIYGAAIAMVHDSNATDTLSWKEFYYKFKQYKYLKGSDAIEILLNVYGKSKRILLLVDELNKSPNHVNIMIEIGQILSGYGQVDILVSSLSPGYIDNLLTSSQRPVDYVMLSPLLDSDLGAEECREWADRFFKKYENTFELSKNGFTYRVLSSFYILASGHPRIIEYLLEKLKDNEFIFDEIKNNIKNPNRTTISRLILLLAGELNSIGSDYLVRNDNLTLNMILTTISMAIKSPDANKIRQFVEEGSILLFQSEEKKYQPMVRFDSFLTSLLNIKPEEFTEEATSISARVSYAKILFGV